MHSTLYTYLLLFRTALLDLTLTSPIGKSFKVLYNFSNPTPTTPNPIMVRVTMNVAVPNLETSFPPCLMIRVRWTTASHEFLHLLHCRGGCTVTQKHVHILHGHFPFLFRTLLHRLLVSPHSLRELGRRLRLGKGKTEIGAVCHGKVRAGARKWHHQVRGIAEQCRVPPGAVSHLCPDGSTHNGRMTKPVAPGALTRARS